MCVCVCVCVCVCRERVKSNDAMCWVNLQCRGVLLIWIIVRRGPIALAVGACGVVSTFFSHICLFSFSVSGRRPDID